MPSRDVETPRSRSLLIPLLLGLFLPQLLLRLPAVAGAGPLALLVPSVEAFLWAAVVGICARLWPEGRRIVPPIAAVLVEFLFVFSLTDALLSRFFNRPLALATDFYLLGGSFLDDLAFMILATPIFFPAVVKLGFDPLWFGMLIAITVMIGVVIPPVAMNVFGVIYRGVLPFLAGLVLCAALLFVFPQMATLLPRLLMK